MKFLAALIILIIFVLIAKVFPYKKSASKPSKHFEALKLEYKAWEWKFALMILVITVVSAFLIKPLLAFISSSAIAPGNSVYYVVPEANIWFVPATILGLAISIYVIDYLGRLILKYRMAEYHHYTNLKHGYDGSKFVKPITWFLLAVAMVVTLGYSNNFISIGEDEIVYHELRTISPKSYSFDEIEGVYYVENKKHDDNLVYDPHYYLEFKDGAIWNTLTGLTQNEKDQEIFKFISFKANLAIEKVPYLEK
ncbi:MAG: hypothetical protein GQ574_09225 [Crocinitomix sp.]|nr:hypothetical protein [Crocinitomix sp.]